MRTSNSHGDVVETPPSLGAGGDGAAKQAATGIFRVLSPIDLSAMLSIWHLRPALQRRFPLHRGQERDRLRFLAWCATDGMREYAVLRESTSFRRVLSQRAVPPLVSGDDWEGLHSLASICHGIAVHRWSLSGMLDSARARNLAAAGFWRGARHAVGAPQPAWQREALLRRFGSPAGLARSVCRRKDRQLDNNQLVQLYGLQDLESPPCDDDQTQDLAPIALARDLAHSPWPLPRVVARLAEPALQLVRGAPSHPESVAVMKEAMSKSPSPPRIRGQKFGINLIGFSHGELGIGEDIRHVATALDLQGIPVCILDFAPGKNISQAEHSADRYLSSEPKYGMNIFCLTGIETVRYACERGLSALDGRYNIGLWPWELPDWPENCRHAYSFVDELWGISNHTAHAHRHAAPRPVLTMGLPVELGPVGPQDRKHFGLPKDAYLYAFAFDTNSNAKRKHVRGLVHAFRKAFPPGTEPNVGLVLKVSHAETGGRELEKLRALAETDPRIHLIERTVRRPELLALIGNCDCYVSLHRAEGFGRCLAEALLLGKQVIATGFSGNTDFCREPRVALVRHRLVPLGHDDYMWGAGQSWAEPDLDHAASLMRLVRQSPRALDNGPHVFEPAVVGRRYASRLREIWTKYGPNAST